MDCVVCGAGPVSPRFLIEKFEPAFTISECNCCGCLMRDPMPENPDLYYSSGYYEGSANFHYIDERKMEKAGGYVFRSRLNTIRKFIPTGNFLDVGCAFGAFARAAAGWYTSMGIDVSAWAVAQAERYYPHTETYKGVFHGSLLTLPENKFFTSDNIHVITMIEVAEHLQSPMQTFEAAFKLLSPGGMLLIQTANFEGWQAVSQGKDYHYFLPGHLVYYKATALKKMLGNIGFGSFREFFPVDFSLWAKIRKSAAVFNHITEYAGLWKMALYHLNSKRKIRGMPATSSYVLYAFKP